MTLPAGPSGQCCCRTFGRFIASASCVSLAVVLLATGSVRAADDTRLTGILNRASIYVGKFEHDFTEVISDESYEQHVERQTHQISRAPTERHMKSEMIFMWIPDERVLLSARNVLEVDGKAIPDSLERIERVLNGPADARTSRLRQLLDEGARFNLGPVVRNVAEPTLPLKFLDPGYQPRFTFSLAGYERMGDADVARVRFAEHAHPTVITNGAADLLSNGMLWVRASDGVVVRTKMEVTIRTPENNLTVSITVNYARNSKLDMWVPARMDERYRLTAYSESAVVGFVSLPVDVVTSCVAKYSNFRRFDTSARIIR